MSKGANASARETWRHVREEPPTDHLVEANGLFGRKWHPVVLYHLLVAGPMGFAELEERIADVSSKMLSESLETLEEDLGLVDREIVSDRPLRVEYSLTARGAALEPVLEALLEWSRTHGGSPREDQDE